MNSATTTAPATTKIKSMKIGVTIPVSVEYGKNEKGAYTAKVLGLKGKDGEELYYTHKEKDALAGKVEKGATAAAKHLYASSMQSSSCCGTATGSHSN